MLDVVYGHATDPGKLRKLNEDASAAFIPKSRQEARERGWMFVVADGVGGLNLGEVAAARTVQTIAKGFALAPPGTSPENLLRQLIQRANSAVRDEELKPGRRGKKMASTVVSCALRFDTAYVAHVGDSRCYHVRNGKASRLTQDHTVVNQQQQLGLITEEDAARSEIRHVLTRSLGPEEFVAVQTVVLTLRAEDRLVLCSDGVSNNMSEEDIARCVLQEKHVQHIAEELVARAVDVDGTDNATAQVIFVRSVESVAMYRGRPYRIPGI